MAGRRGKKKNIENNLQGCITFEQYRFYVFIFFLFVFLLTTETTATLASGASLFSKQFFQTNAAGFCYRKQKAQMRNERNGIDFILSSSRHYFVCWIRSVCATAECSSLFSNNHCYDVLLMLLPGVAFIHHLSKKNKFNNNICIS